VCVCVCVCVRVFMYGSVTESRWDYFINGILVSYQ
jgi:hypothetical protein